MLDADVVVIGGGVVGLATAVDLAERHRQRVVVLEAEAGVAAHQSGHNSGVIHSGLYYPPGSQKAALCRAGLGMMYAFCEREAIPVERTGKLVVASGDGDLPRLAELEARGRANGVTLRRVAAAELREIEPSVVGRAGLWVEDTGVVDFREVARAMTRRIAAAGGATCLGSRVTAIRRDGNGFVVASTGSEVRTRRVVSCAGAQADRVARMTGPDPGVRIVTFRGEYYTLRADRARLVRGLIYPVPDPSLPFLGVHFTRRIDGTIDAGPNAVLTLARDGYRRGQMRLRDLTDWARYPGFWRLLARHWRVGVEEWHRSISKQRFVDSLRRLVPAIEVADLEPAPAGVRAQAVAPDGTLVSDFAFVEQVGVVHVLNAPSPAATASLAIGREVAARSMASR